jgi:kynureninase
VDVKAHFSRFLRADPGRLDFAAHSHHPWPDVTFDAHQQAWIDAADLVDNKWGRIFGEVVPEAQGHAAGLLGVSDPRTIALAPNTHELVMRVMSSLPSPTRILTTDGEFHSFSRQTRRLEEDGLAEVERITTEPYASFPDRFAEAAARGGHDLVFFSHVFYDSAYVVPGVTALVSAVRDDATVVMIDGYHAFMARDVDISAIEQRAFYLTGGYKYAMAGEGACTMHCPDDYVERPRNTGWFASFGTLQAGVSDQRVPYTTGGLRFLGATLDPTPWYRFNAVQRWMLEIGLNPEKIHRHVRHLQDQFIAAIDGLGLPISGDRLLPPPDADIRGNFLTFRHPDAGAFYRRLHDEGVLTDWRTDRLRLGFGIYHDESDVDELVARAVAAFD